MRKIAYNLIAAVAIAAAGVSVPAAAQDAQEVSGIVVTNENGVLTVKTPAGDQTIQLGSDVRIRSVSGVFGGQKEDAPAASLLPGLPVMIEMKDGAASEINYKASDYKTAAQIQAGVQATAKRSEANEARSLENQRKEAELRSAYSQVGEWEIKGETTVYFNTGSAAISPEGKKELTNLAVKAKGIKGYVISVLGYADPTGDAAANERLSERRAQAVINYLKQSGEVLPGKVMAASAMGETALKASEDNPANYASARRVTARILTSKALLSSASQ